MSTQKNYTTKSNRIATINKSNPRYSHLSEDSIAFLAHCERIGANPILRTVGKPAEFEMRRFRNGDPQDYDFFCVRHLASLSNREILTRWSLYQVKDKGYLLQVNDFNNPVFFYHLVYDDMTEIADAFVAPTDLLNCFIFGSKERSLRPAFAEGIEALRTSGVFTTCWISKLS